MESPILFTLLLSSMALISLFVPSSAQTCTSYTFSGNRVFSQCSVLPVLSSYLHWTYHQSNATVDIAFRKEAASTSNWIAWALNPTQQAMVGSQALVAYQFSNASMTAFTTPISSVSPSMQPGNLSFQVSDLSAEYRNATMIIFATLHLNDQLFSTNQVWQEGPVSNNQASIHPMDSQNMNSVGTINFMSGAVSSGGGESGSRLRKRNIHGVLNAVSWGILMPLGAIIARYLKVFKSVGPAWFYLHAACQSSAYVVGVAGWGTGLKLGSDSAGIQYDAHRNIGITLFCFGTLQVFALLLRPKPDHKYRMYWNIYHHLVGYTTIVLAIINIFKGFDILNPAKKWKNTYIGFLIFFALCVVILEPFTWFLVLKKKKASGKNVNVPSGAA